jgi:hypothetical protein
MRAEARAAQPIAMGRADAPPIAARIAALDWARIGRELDGFGAAVTGALLTPQECAALASAYGDDGSFRSRVVMARHGFGRGEYKYFAYPRTEIVAALRTALYPPLATLANRWNEQLDLAQRYPADHASYLRLCHGAGQTKPTPLLLRYGAGDYNCLHQDLYGEQVFPLQATFLLSAPGSDFTGGEFVLVEQRPRQQSRPQVMALGQGDGVVFAVNHRPARGARGFHRVKLRHGVSRVHTGRRQTLGIIFHDAQ